MNWSEPYREIRFDGKIFQVRKRHCDCECHLPGRAIMHFMACCESDWVYQRKIVQPLGTKKLPLNMIVPESYRKFRENNPNTFIAIKP